MHDNETVDSSQTTASERRGGDRLSVDIEVDYLSGENERHFSYAINLSRGGIFIYTRNPEPPGTRLTIELNPLEWPDPLRLDGSVVWYSPHEAEPGMGVRFGGLDAKAEQQIEKLLRRLSLLPQLGQIADQPH